MPVTEPQTPQPTPTAGPPPTPQPRAVVCPYCGHISGDTARCARCGGRFEPLSRQATQNAMGPWAFIDPAVPTRPGCSYETLRTLIQRGTVRRDSVVRGPSTRQFWMLATRVPGIAHIFGVCHSCQKPASPDDYSCAACGAVFEVDKDRQHLGVGPVRLIAKQASADQIAASYGVAPSAAPPAAGAQAPAIAAAAPRIEPPERAPAQAATPEPAPASNSPRARIERRKHQRARKRMITITLTAVGVVVVGLAMFAMGMLANAGDEPAPAGTSASP